MNDFESERAAKAARFRQLAEKHDNIATGRRFAERKRLPMIPLNQPIPVGHRSEKRHRKDLNCFNRYFAGRVGFPNYVLTNNSANIRRLEKRLAAIQNTQHDETTEEQFASGVRLVDNVEANRLQIFSRRFPRK